MLRTARGNRETTERLRDQVEHDTAPDDVLSWGYGTAHLRDSALGHHVEHCAFVLASDALHLIGDGPEPTLTTIAFAQCYHFDVGQDEDGLWEIMFDLLGPVSPTRPLGFTIVETYGGLSPEACARSFAASVREAWLAGARRRTSSD